MQETITVTLPAEIEPALDEMIQREDISLGELVAEASEEHLFFRRFRLLREQMVPKAQAQGIYTDQDVLARFMQFMIPFLWPICAKRWRPLRLTASSITGRTRSGKLVGD